MRHQHKGFKLGRTHAHRQATLAALSSALIEHKSIRTTVTKAKALRMYIEPLVTRSKEDTTHNRREVFRYLQNKHAVTELFTEVVPKVGDRPGGYTRVVKLGPRSGDGAEMAVIEFVDFNESEVESTSSGRSRRTRRGGGGRRGRRRSAETTAAATTAARKDSETPKAQDESSPAEEAESTEVENLEAEAQADVTEQADAESASAESDEQPAEASAEDAEAPDAEESEESDDEKKAD